MDNYLSHRWPKGPAIQPPPVPDLTARPAPRQRAKRSPRRWVVPLVCVVLVLILMGGISAWAVNGLANLLKNAEFPSSSDDPAPRRTWPTPGSSNSHWTLDDLPWGKPDPSVQLSVAPVTEAVLSGRDIHEKVLPSIVYVRAQQKGASGSYFTGTGIIVTASGYVLTNFHIIEETDRVQVMLLTDQTSDYYEAKVIGVDEKFDLAVLKFSGERLNLTPARLGDSDALAVGDTVYAEGNPMGYLLGSMSSGIVSALGRDSEVNSDGLGLIQTDVPLNPGNSGGALVNERGEVVGITSAKITGLVRESGESFENAAVIENIGLAIPISDVLPFVNRILATGKSWRPSIGIQCVETEVDGRRGIQVRSVDKGAPAREAGLRENDLIISANGQQVTDLITLRRVIYRTGADSQLHCVVVREGKELPISFALIDKLGQD